MTSLSHTLTSAPARPGVVRALRVVAPLIVLSVLVQAVFAGRGLFLDTGNLAIHGGIGTLTLLLATVQAVLVLFAVSRGRTRIVLVTASLALLLLVVVQLGLGYSGRGGGQAAAWHVPNGVLIFGIAVGMAVSLNANNRS